MTTTKSYDNLNRLLSIQSADAQASTQLQVALAFYDPTEGRCLNRDPIAETGGMSLYAFVYNNSLNKADFIGLDFLIESYQTTLATVRTPGNCAPGYFGCLVGPFISPSGDAPNLPVVTVRGTDEIAIDRRGTKYCARVVNAAAIDVEGRSFTPNDVSLYDDTLVTGRWLIGNFQTDIIGHEGRRVEAYSRAYDAYFAPSQGTGSYATRCEFCDCYQWKAESLLRNYLSRLRDKATIEFNAYVQNAMDNITLENEHWHTVPYIDVLGNMVTAVDGLVPGYAYPVQPVPPFTPPLCRR